MNSISENFNGTLIKGRYLIHMRALYVLERLILLSTALAFMILADITPVKCLWTEATLVGPIFNYQVRCVISSVWHNCLNKENRNLRWSLRVGEEPSNPDLLLAYVPSDMVFQVSSRMEGLIASMGTFECLLVQVSLKMHLQVLILAEGLSATRVGALERKGFRF